MIYKNQLLAVGCNIDAESWARVLVKVRGARDIMHRMQPTWEALAKVDERRSGRTFRPARHGVFLSLRCCKLHKTYGVAAPPNLVHSVLFRGQNCHVNLWRTLIL